jgi:flavin-dependent dehydrogenase
MKYDYDLIIVGGGPSGSTMALSAQKQGLQVLLVDKEKFPRDKICGDALTVSSLNILDEFNLIEPLLQESHGCANNMVFYSEQARLSPPSMNKSEFISTSRRMIFDNVLFQAAKAVVDTKEGFKVEQLLVKNNLVFGIQGSSEDGRSHEYTAKVVAGADGCSSVVPNRTIHGNGFILAGDAAGLIDPLIGHGIDRAMMSGKIAGELLGSICQGCDYSDRALQPYADAIWKHFGSISQFAVKFRDRLHTQPLAQINALLYKNMGNLTEIVPVVNS